MFIFIYVSVFISCGTLCVLGQDANPVSAPPVNFECGVRGPLGISFNEGAKDEIPPRQNTLGKVIAVPNSYPWMALLGRTEKSSTFYFCGGVLINDQFVLSVVECASSLDPFFVILGAHDYKVPSNPPKEKIGVGEVIIHPKFDPQFRDFNVVLLKLKKPIVFRNEIRPICLPWGNEINADIVDRKVTVSGWGATTFGGPSSSVLRTVEVTAFSASLCEERYTAFPRILLRYKIGLIKENIVCAGDLLGGKDACTGDSGGPLSHERTDGSFILDGLVSDGVGCGNPDFPAIYSSLRNYDTLLWIKETAF